MTEQEIEEVTARLFVWFVHFLGNGFTEDQALKLVIGMLTDGL